jgi:nucleoside-diphosphate-sugar epimerase
MPAYDGRIKRNIRAAVVTGPTGAIGIALCERLLSENIKVYALVRPDSLRAARLPEGSSVIPCGLSELGRLRDMIPEGSDAFFHLGWEGTSGAGRNDVIEQERNIRYTLEAVSAAKSLGCKVFIGAGSQAEHGRSDAPLRSDIPCFPENGYGIAKLCAGMMSRIECKRNGIEHIWARVLSVYGPGDGENAMIPGVIKKLLRGEKPALTAGGQIWDYLYSDDAADAFFRMAVSGIDGAVYPLGSGKGRRLREYVETLRDSINPSLPLGFGELPYGPLQVMTLVADISELYRDTGFRPRIPFEEGIKRTIKWFGEN